MPELRISLDPCNPGQFYACCGLIELFDIWGAQTLSHFEHDSILPRRAAFVLTSESNLNVSLVAEALKSAQYEMLPRRAAKDASTPGEDTIAPAKVLIFGKKLPLDWWLDYVHEKATWLKCWAGQVTTQKLFATLSGLICSESLSFEHGVLTTSRFGIDPRSAWVALNLGYSPNEQGQDAVTYPFVEMLAAVGLQGFRPKGTRSEGFTYCLWLSPLTRSVARTACAEPWDGLAHLTYAFPLEERGSYKYFGFAEPINFT